MDQLSDDRRKRRPSCQHCPQARHLTRFCPKTDAGRRARAIAGAAIVTRMKARRTDK